MQYIARKLREHFFSRKNGVTLSKHPYQVENPHKKRTGEYREHGEYYPHGVVFYNAFDYAAYSVKNVCEYAYYNFDYERQSVRSFEQIFHFITFYYI